MTKVNQLTQLNIEDFKWFGGTITSITSYYQDAEHAIKDVKSFFVGIVGAVLVADWCRTDTERCEVLNEINEEYTRLINVCEAVSDEEWEERRERYEATTATIDAARQTYCETAGRHEPDASVAM